MSVVPRIFQPIHTSLSLGMDKQLFKRNADRPIVSLVVTNAVEIQSVVKCTPHHIRVMTCAMAPPESEMKAKKEGFWYIFPSMQALTAYCVNIRDLPATTEITSIPLADSSLFGMPTASQICIGLGVKRKDGVTLCVGGIFKSE